MVPSSSDGDGAAESSADAPSTPASSSSDSSAHSTSERDTSERDTSEPDAAASGADDASSPVMATTIGRLHVITDFKFQQELSHATLARLAIRGGADTVQFRQKHGGIRNILSQARETQAVCRDASIPLIVDDRIDVAQAVGAAGVHLGQEDFPIADGRRLLGEDAIIGATANKVSEAVEAYEAGATYIGFGPVFETGSKRNPKSVVGLETLDEVCGAVPIPVIAIGGITHDRVRPALEAGAHGVAVLSAIATSKNPERAAARFRAAIDGALRTS
jgi:thiamine-phosphate pyrophosphorylase